MDRPPPRTLLEQLIRRSHRTIEENCVAFERTAGNHGERATLSPRHLSRWMAGKVKSSRPVAQRVAALHWGYDFERLIGPPLSEVLLTATGKGNLPRQEDATLSGSKRLELLRRNVHDALTAGWLTEDALDEWEKIVQAHGLATRYQPAELLLGELASDFAELHHLMTQRHPASSMRRLARVTAQMAGLMFLTLIKLNEPFEARNWARTARAAADEAGDNTVCSWVRAQEAYVHYYSGNLAGAMALADQALMLAGREQCAGVPLAAALQGRALARLGIPSEARRALEKAETTLSELDDESQSPSAFGYSEAQLRFHEGNAYTHMHDMGAARAAQTRALDLYPAQDFLDRTLVKLDRAACLIHAHQTDEAIHQASNALLDLTREQRCGLVLARSAEVLRGLPSAQRALPTAREFHDLLVLIREEKSA